MNDLSLVQNGPNLRDIARWDFPPKDWYKVNLDVASKGNPGTTACGIIIRNMNRDRMGGMAIPIGIQTSHVEEASAAPYGINYERV